MKSASHALPPPSWPAWLVGLLIFAVALAVTLPGLGTGPLAYTEGVRALTGHHTLHEGNWLVTRLYGAVYLQKPPLHYWMLAATEWLLGTANEWVWRLPSALSGAGLAWLLWFFGRRWFGADAGLVAGGGAVGLVVLWTQWRSAEIDGLNTLFSVATALILLDAARDPAPPRRGWICGLALSLCFGASLLLKGPAGLPVILGALMGAGIAARSLRWFRRPSVWLGLLGGAALFLAWIIAAKLALRVTGAPLDISVAEELAERLNLRTQWRAFGAILLAPLEVALFSLPFILAIGPWLQRGPRRTWPATLYRPYSALIWSYLAGSLIGVLALISNPRYLFLLAPLLPLTMAALTTAWQTGHLSVAWQRVLQRCIRWGAWAGALFLVGAAWVACRAPAPPIWQVALALSLGALATAAVTRATQRAAWRSAAARLALLILIAAWLFGHGLVVRRHARSSASTAEAMRQHVPAGALVHAETMVRYHPEAFYYAGVQVQRYPHGIDDWFQQPASGWYLLHPWEWDVWGRPRRHMMTSYQRLPGPDQPYLCLWP